MIGNPSKLFHAAGMSANLPAARALTKTELIHETLRRGILSLEHQPGDYLNIDELARRHQVSPIPVREAIARLAAERLVVMRPHIGAEVAPLDETSVREVFAFLEGLETATADDIVARATAEDVAVLTAILATMDQMHLPRDLAQWDEANADFHLRLSAIAGLPLLHDHLKRVLEHWDRIRRYFFSLSSDRGAKKAQTEHRAMIKALREKDGPLLTKLLHQHNARARQNYLKQLASSR
jgi:DNA-binding GntR family transcriptional regulator